MPQCEFSSLCIEPSIPKYRHISVSYLLHFVEPIGNIDLTRCPSGKPKAETHTFFVHPNAPFDVIFGVHFIVNDALSIFSNPEPLLALIKLGKLSKGTNVRMTGLSLLVRR